MANIEPLRPFQEEDVPWFLSHLKSMILYEPRLGKTVVTCNVLAGDPLTSDVLITCSKNAVAVWIDHLQTWLKHLRPNWGLDIRVVLVSGANAKAKRTEMWTRPRMEGYITIYITTFATALFDEDILVANKIKFDTVIGDEVHTKLRNRKTKTTKQFKRLTKECRRFHALSGTLAGKWGPADLWNLLNLCSPREFSSYWQFFNMFVDSVQGMYGLEIVGTKNMENFKLIQQRFARIRDRKTHGAQMPTVVRDTINVDMSTHQKRIYDSLEEVPYAMLDNGDMVIAKNSLVQMLYKRQLLTCPKILDPSTNDLGGAFEWVLDYLDECTAEEDEQGQHIVIFTAVRKAIPYWAAELKARGRSVHILTGGIEPHEQVRTIAEWKKSRGIMLCTTQYAQAFSLDTAQVCFHIGWDWDPNNNKQAEDRLVGQSGDHHINSWYFVYNNTNDPFYADIITRRSKFIRATNHNLNTKLSVAEVDPIFMSDE